MQYRVYQHVAPITMLRKIEEKGLTDCYEQTVSPLAIYGEYDVSDCFDVTFF